MLVMLTEVVYNPSTGTMIADRPRSVNPAFVICVEAIPNEVDTCVVRLHRGNASERVTVRGSVKTVTDQINAAKI